MAVLPLSLIGRPSPQIQQAYSTPAISTRCGICGPATHQSQRRQVTRPNVNPFRPCPPSHAKTAPAPSLAPLRSQRKEPPPPAPPPIPIPPAAPSVASASTHPGRRSFRRQRLHASRPPPRPVAAPSVPRPSRADPSRSRSARRPSSRAHLSASPVP